MGASRSDFKRRALFAVTSAAFVFATPESLGSQAARVYHKGRDQAHYTALMSKIIDTWSSTNGVLLEPLLAEGFASELVTFDQNFCYEGNDAQTKAACEDFLKGDARITNAVTSYLDFTVLRAAPKAPALIEFFARQIGHSASELGWNFDDRPTLPPYTLPFPPSPTATLATPRGEVLIPYPVRIVVLRPGDYTLTMHWAGRSDRVSLHLGRSATDHRASTERGSASSAAATIRRRDLGFDWNLACLDEGGATVQGQGTYAFGRSATPAQRSRVATAPSLRIRIRDPQAKCSGDCRDVLVSHLLDAIAVWRGGCQQCAGGALQVVHVDGVPHVDEAVLGAAEQETGGQRGVFLMALKAPAASIGRTFRRYRALGSTSGLMTLLARPSALAPEEEALRRALVGRPLPDEEASLEITLQGRLASCGEDRDVIACTTVDRNVELNTADFRFVLGQRGREPRFLLGAGPDDVELNQILIHEVGHWFGIPHVAAPTRTDQRLAMMDRTYGVQGKCISRDEYGFLNQAADLRWRDRLTACDGLRFPRSRR